MTYTLYRDMKSPPRPCPLTKAHTNLKLLPYTITKTDQNLTMQPYPTHWPQPTKTRPTSVASRITEAQKLNLFNRVITTRDLAKDLDVHERYLSSLFPGKIEVVDKKPIIAARKLYKLELAKLVIAGTYTTRQAAEISNSTYKTMARFVKKVREQENLGKPQQDTNK